MSATCPHCSAANPTEAQFCESCGKALPAGLPRGPRIIGEREFASSSAGRDLQLQQLNRKARTVTNTLAVLCVLQFIGSAVLLAVSRSGSFQPQEQRLFLAMAITVGIAGAVFLGLSLWSRRSPLAAAIVGLVILITWWTADAVIQPLTILQGIIIKIIVIAALVRAIQAGVSYRALKRQLESTPPGAA